MSTPTPKAVHYTDVPAQTYGDEAPGVTIRWVIDEAHDGAPNYSLRVIEVAPGGHTPDHTHPFEHENFVIEGRGRVRIESTWHEVGPGSVVFVPPGVRHTYENVADTPFRFLCGIPTPRLMQQG
jgi:quercetin dioxygenase-like cupin family protein